MAGADLTEQQRADLGKLLGSPLEYPAEFKEWVPQWLAQNLPYIPVTQIAGAQTLKPWYGVILTSENTSEKNVWGDIFATAGPRVDDVSGGDYLVIWGYYFGRAGAGGAKVKAGVSIDGNDPTGAAICDAPFDNDQASFNWKAARISVPQDGLFHFVKLKYFFDDGGSGAQGNVSNRWLMLIRVK